jgi:hypothetical protein
MTMTIIDNDIAYPPTCLDSNTACSGKVEYRTPLSGTGIPYPRCDHHWDKRLKIQEEINQRYAPFSDVPPEGFDPTYAGERWDEEY